MMLIGFIGLLADVIIWTVFIYAILTFIFPPYHSARLFLERLISPLLDPIRRIIPPMGGFDLSPMALILLVIVLQSILINLIRLF